MKLVKRISFVFFILIAACSNNSYDNKTIAKAYVDIMVSREQYANNLDTLSSVRNYILAKYNLSSTKYEKALDDLKTDEKLWEDFYKDVYNYLDSLKADAGIN